MEPSGHKSQTQKRTTRHSSQLTLMVTRGMGKVRTFKISSRVLFWSSLFFVFYIIASILVFNKYFDELRARRDQAGQLEQIEAEIEETKRELYRSKQRLAFLEDYFYDPKPGEERRDQSTGPETGGQEGAALRMANLAEGSEPAQRAVKDPREVLVEIKDLDVRRRGRGLTVGFRLTKKQRDRKALSGYVHIIAMNKGPNTTQFWTYPKVALRNGLPVNYKHGERFRIRNFKMIRGRYFFDSDSQFPSHVKVLVYSQGGELILREEFKILDS